MAALGLQCVSANSVSFTSAATGNPAPSVLTPAQPTSEITVADKATEHPVIETDKHQEIISHTVYKIASPYITGPY